MAVAMAVMPWTGGCVLPEVQPAWFASAAVWFPLSAVRHRQESRPVAAARRQPYAAGTVHHCPPGPGEAVTDHVSPSRTAGAARRPGRG
ncbi:hypothetical protein CTZ28_15085 [Streptomyces shenzhenensis]|uniref:Uncharacterized protein n=1 Tax=Streptomyces shenzhenensis TaxID=943815 RepID=A0A3M0IF99_9ACTN|nr:hypothetical protein CTZ28_15085 [Streptomyces shenzhenensis]